MGVVGRGGGRPLRRKTSTSRCARAMTRWTQTQGTGQVTADGSGGALRKQHDTELYHHSSPSITSVVTTETVGVNGTYSTPTEMACLLGCCTAVMTHRPDDGGSKHLNIYQTARHIIPEGSRLRIRRHDNLKSNLDENRLQNSNPKTWREDNITMWGCRIYSNGNVMK